MSLGLPASQQARRRIMLVAGEPSGDALGARLMSALRLRTMGAVSFSGIGGEQMQAAGLKSIFPMSDLSVMGLFEVLPRLRLILRRLDEAEHAVRQINPDILITIDSPGFNFRLAKRLSNVGFPLVHYVAPTVWAWKPGRARKVAGLFDHLLALFPFEPPWFEREGLNTMFVGHPAVETLAATESGAEFRTRHGIEQTAPLLVLLPGSRMGEVKRHLPVFRETVLRLALKFPGLRTVLPTVETVAMAVEAEVATWPLPPVIVRSAREKFASFRAGRAALAASGTVTLETSLAGLPTVLTYRMNPLTYMVARQLVKIPAVGLTNILLDRPVMPELLQDRCSPDLLAEAIAAVMVDGPARTAQIEAGQEAMGLLQPDGRAPSLAAADAVLRAQAIGPRRARLKLPPLAISNATENLPPENSSTRE